MKKEHGKILILGSALAFIMLSILRLAIDAFLIDVVSYFVIRFILSLVAIAATQVCFRTCLTESRKMALVLCAITLILDLTVIDTLRFILFGGEYSSVLLLPACLPICGMIISLFAIKDKGKGKKAKAIALIVGILILLLAVNFEIYSFIYM